MAITRQQPGAAAAAGTAGAIIGASQKAVREQAEAAALKRQQLQIEAREAAEKRAYQWEQQKMEINSLRAFERENRQEDYRLLAEDRSAERAIERIEFSKDLDFQYKTQERQRKLKSIDADEAALDKVLEKGEATEDEFAIKMARLKIDNRRRAIETGLPLERMTKEDQLALMMSDISGGTTGGGADVTVDAPPAGPIPVQKMEAIAAIGKTYVVRKSTGENVSIPIENAKKAIETGRFIWPKVIGDSQFKKQFPDIVRQETARLQRGSFAF